MAKHDPSAGSGCLRRLLGVFLLLVVTGAAFVLGYEAHKHLLIPAEVRYAAKKLIGLRIDGPQEPKQGRWRTYTKREDVARSTDDLIEELEAVGYMSGYKPAHKTEGVVYHDPSLAYTGCNLYSSGHASEAILMDMEGNTLHTWRRDIRDVWPDYTKPAEAKSDNADYWRRVHLFENGDLLAIWGGIGIIKLDKDSNVLWANPCHAHHDMTILEDGTMYLLTRKAHVLPKVNEIEPILEDFYAIMDADGQIKNEVSLVDAFENSDYYGMLDLCPPAGDIMHTNTIKFLDGRHADRSPVFKATNLLVSVRETNTIAIIDQETERVVWALTGLWQRQHEPVMLDNGRIMVFDNQGNQGKSRVIEIHPFTQEITWSYGTEPGEELFSHALGTCARLPNGNTLITESDNGRAIEVTPDKRVVWEFISPHRTGEDLQLVATLTHVTRMPADFPLDWAHAKDTALAQADHL
jgi:hypothetical protein